MAAIVIMVTATIIACSFNVDNFHCEELFPTTPHHGPMMKRSCGMIAVQLDGEDYLVVIGGWGPFSNTHTQVGAEYDNTGIDDGLKTCNEIHYYKLSSGQYNMIISLYTIIIINDIHHVTYTHYVVHMCILICTVWGILCG